MPIGKKSGGALFGRGGTRSGLTRIIETKRGFDRETPADLKRKVERAEGAIDRAIAEIARLKTQFPDFPTENLEEILDSVKPSTEGHDQLKGEGVEEVQQHDPLPPGPDDVPHSPYSEGGVSGLSRGSQGRVQDLGHVSVAPRFQVE